MSKWSEQDIDSVFQKGSEAYDFKYDPEAWKDMEQLLDERKRRRGLWWWLFGVGTTLLLVVFALLFYPSENTKEIKALSSNSETEAIKNTKLEISSPAAQAGNGVVESRNQEYSLRGNTTTELRNGSEKKVTPPRTETSPLFKEKTSPGNAPPKAAEKMGSFEMDSGRPVPARGKEPEGEPVTASEQSETQRKNFPTKEIVIDVPQKKLSNEVAQLSLSPEEIVTLPILPISPFGQKEEQVDWPGLPFFKKNKKGEIRPVLRSDAFSLGFSVGSEWNSVGFGDFSQQNWKYGMYAEYHFQKRFGIGLGATWMRMDYDAGEGEYTPGAGFWTDGIVPQSTFGRCDMLEIPLQFTYHFKGYGRDGFFFSAGISSYWIMEEHYWYRYDSPRTDLVFYWGTDTDERTWLNLGLVSFGYQKLIAPRASLSMEPYAQFPLSGVGHGAVEIFSIGLKAKMDFWLRK